MIVLDFLKRCVLAVLSFGIALGVLYLEIEILYAVIVPFTQGQTADAATQAAIKGAKNVLQEASTINQDTLSTLSLVVAGAGGLLFAVSCLSRSLGDALLWWRQWSTAFISFGYSFCILFLPLVCLSAIIVKDVTGFTANYMSDDLQRHNALKTVSKDALNFENGNERVILMVVALVTALIAWYITLKLAFSDKLPWCRISVTPRRPSPAEVRNSIREATVPLTKPKIPERDVASSIKAPSPTRPAPSVPATVAIRNPVKDKLFGNLPLDQWPPPGGDSTTFPWSEFDAARTYLQMGQTAEAIARWQTVIATSNLESLHYAQAWHFLRQNGVHPSPEEAKTIYGVVGEQGPSGVLTAVFSDGQARVYSDQGQGIVWEHPDDSLDLLIESILAASTALVQKIQGNDPQLGGSKSSINSISFLTPSGIYIKTGAPNVFEAAPKIKPIADGLGKVLLTLMEKTKQTP